MNLTAIIVDDEPMAIQSLQIQLESYCPGLQVIGAASTVDDAVSLIDELKPNIVFLDIELPTGSGFEVVERTNHLVYNPI